MGKREDILWEASREHLILWKADWGKITNLTLQQTSETSKLRGAKGFSTVVFDNGSAILENSTLSSTDSATILVTGAAAAPIIRTNDILDGQRYGILFGSSGKAQIYENVISKTSSLALPFMEVALVR